jgi:hypothetical protein
MKRLLWGMIFLSLAMAAAAPVALGAGKGGGVPIRVSPGTGGIHTNFVLRFSIPDASGITGDVDVADSVSVTGEGHRGCVGEAELPLRSAPAGTAFKLTLNPSHLDGHWCTGRFSGALVERRTTICAPVPEQIVCPLYVVAPRVLGRFRFTVAAPKMAAQHR